RAGRLPDARRGSRAALHRPLPAPDLRLRAGDEPLDAARRSVRGADDRRIPALPARRRRERARARRRGRRTMRVDELMTRDVVTVAPDTPLREVAELLVAHRISGVPVCNCAGEVVGVVSEQDVLYKELGPDERGGGPLARLAGRPDAAAVKAGARTG